MIIRALIIALALSSAGSALYARDIEMSAGVRVGHYPEMGGNLNSYFQETELGISNGVYGINRTSEGADTSTIKPPFGRYAGIQADLIFLRHFIMRVSLNAAETYYEGRGVTLDPDDNEMKVKYSVKVYDLPIAFGLAVPVRDIARISLCAGVAISYGKYSNSFKSENYSSSGTFSGYAAPLVIMLKGEYFFTENISFNSSVNRYMGATRSFKSGDDYARIDFTSTRWDIGLSYHFKIDTEVKREDIYSVE